MIPVQVSRVDGSDPDGPLPTYETAQAAGLDLRANLAPSLRADGLSLGPRDHVLVPTGLSIALPEGYELQVRPRSGLALRHGITLLNAPGTIDADYRGEIGVILWNTSDILFVVAHGARIAQAVLAPVARLDWAETKTLSQTDRGSGGFGSTGG